MTEMTVWHFILKYFGAGVIQTNSEDLDLAELMRNIHKKIRQKPSAKIDGGFSMYQNIPRKCRPDPCKLEFTNSIIPEAHVDRVSLLRYSESFDCELL